MNKLDQLGERMSEAAAHCLFTLINWMEQVYDLLEPIIVPLCRIGGLVGVLLLSWVVVAGAACVIGYVLIELARYFGWF